MALPRFPSMPRLPLHRWIPAALAPLLLAASAVANPPAAQAQAQAPGATTAAMADQNARQAADRILITIRDRNADAYYGLMAPETQRVSSPSMVAQSMAGLPKLESWTITSVEPGLDGSTVTALLQTGAGPKQLLLVLDGKGRLAAYQVNLSDQPSVEVVKRFMDALIGGQFVSASSYLGPELQRQMTPASLQKRWQQLQQRTGNVQRVRKIWRAEKTSQMKLVIVTTEFNRLTDNLFVTLDSANRILSIDFPLDASPSPAAP